MWYTTAMGGMPFFHLSLVCCVLRAFLVHSLVPANTRPSFLKGKHMAYDVDRTPITMIITERLMAMPFANQGVSIVMAVVHTHLGSYYQEWQEYYQMMQRKGHMNLQCMLVLRSPFDAALLYEQSQTPKDNPVAPLAWDTPQLSDVEEARLLEDLSPTPRVIVRELDDGIEEEPTPSWKEPNDYTKDGW